MLKNSPCKGNAGGCEQCCTPALPKAAGPFEGCITESINPLQHVWGGMGLRHTRTFRSHLVHCWPQCSVSGWAAGAQQHLRGWVSTREATGAVQAVGVAREQCVLRCCYFEAVSSAAGAQGRPSSALPALGCLLVFLDEE